ncbi:hypothetical protein CROQUDRAFT_105694 [Cronartium quercuum f. sp. fusiforme G11]|uniref:Secreted protein n=1 Tax=Cronartium quercuum f. sp. fusiforme G11 TaxID=708437 RepID=A0A9P6TDR5_9BASI|nr:hypothetical protein CROQUDRAFT_105694 [Cronartium quercuum f. sp. fusiforme G11]
MSRLTMFLVCFVLFRTLLVVNALPTTRSTSLITRRSRLHRRAAMSNFPDGVETSQQFEHLNPLASVPTDSQMNTIVPNATEPISSDNAIYQAQGHTLAVTAPKTKRFVKRRGHALCIGSMCNLTAVSD